MSGSPNPDETILDRLRELVQVKEVLTVDDLAERWGCSKWTVLDRVKNPECPLPAFALGSPTGPRQGRKTLRFRLEDVKAWEADQVRIHAPTPEARPEPISRIPGYTGPTKPRVRNKRPTL
jgi:hypothetical protein